MRSPSHMTRIMLLLCLAISIPIPPARAQDPALSGEIWAEAEVFRQVGAGDFLRALEMFSTPDANLKFAELAGLIWPIRPGPEAWSGFLRPALINFVAGGYEVETVVFQHPWADVVLLTGWGRVEGRLRIVDIGIATGAMVRGAGVPVPVGAGWMADGVYAPVAVGRGTAATTNAIAAFEAGESANPLASLDEAQIEAMMLAASLQLWNQQASVLPLLVDEPGVARAVRFAWNEIMAAGQQGRLAQVLPDTAALGVLTALEPEFWATLEPVSYLEVDRGAVAQFGSSLNPNLFVALRYEGTGEGGQITAFDLFSFADFLKEATP